jgi:hypothetical protein
MICEGKNYERQFAASGISYIFQGGNGVIPIPIQTCALPLVYPLGKQALFHFVPRSFELERV